ncbi:BLUF domain-containing protein [Euzebyella saccharophila]|uniref:BLUF domain-containing protein n=1 Tax=Euzebyella saccharophila TaxID=679664 RepID=A0ABV8JTX0_9FLAO|nr:BLUF domain-containing protein [Euzebyella saccharophila]
MYTLIYSSKAIHGLKVADIDEILKTARASNSENGITGCLIHYSDKFMQLLEGPEDKVRALFANIQSDVRHDKVILLSEDTITERSFSECVMAYFRFDGDRSGIPEFEQFRKNLFLLADLSRPTNATAILFWKRIKYILSIPAIE